MRCDCDIRSQGVNNFKMSNVSDGLKDTPKKDSLFAP